MPRPWGVPLAQAALPCRCHQTPQPARPLQQTPFRGHSHLEVGDVGTLGGDVSGPIQEVLARNPDFVEHSEPVGRRGPWVRGCSGASAKVTASPGTKTLGRSLQEIGHLQTCLPAEKEGSPGGSAWGAPGDPRAGPGALAAQPGGLIPWDDRAACSRIRIGAPVGDQISSPRPGPGRRTRSTTVWDGVTRSRGGRTHRVHNARGAQESRFPESHGDQLHGHPRSAPTHASTPRAGTAALPRPSRPALPWVCSRLHETVQHCRPLTPSRNPAYCSLCRPPRSRWL